MLLFRSDDFKRLKRQFKSHVLVLYQSLINLLLNLTFVTYCRFMSAQQDDLCQEFPLKHISACSSFSCDPLHLHYDTLVGIERYARCRYTDYSSLGSCLIVWLLVFLALLDLFLATLPCSEISSMTLVSAMFIELMAGATEVKIQVVINPNFPSTPARNCSTVFKRAG